MTATETRTLVTGRRPGDARRRRHYVPSRRRSLRC